ncbi:TadE/TadG family type IV pilus assembly protein [Jannaschia aquimarina]|uniref:TadE/TadG family type IV pilus assembly protein n=1 Tax=Jannaschia aquimarina TaxID=935700 RepID=UPI0011326434|nr:hypothetical protein [Jannaschia aquimarina]
MNEPLIRAGHRVSRFGRDERGAIATEAIIILPVLILFYLVSFTFYDAYRKQTLITKAGYTIGDLLSRQLDTMKIADIEGMAEVLEYLTFPAEGEYLRVTEIERVVETDTVGNVTKDAYEVIWSHATAGKPDLTNADVAGLLRRIPNLAPNERITMLETYTPYDPPFHIGLDPYVMESMTVTRQRFAPKLCFEEIVACQPLS